MVPAGGRTGWQNEGMTGCRRRLFVLALAMAACRTSDPQLAPGVTVEEAAYPEHMALPKPISSRVALRAATAALERRGVRGVRICHLDWIVAPLGAAIVQATGRWETKAGRFNAFAISIYDGTEAKYGHRGGDEHYVVARGIDASGAEVLYDSARVSGPQFFRYEDIDDATVLEGTFEFVSHETLEELPRTCGLRD